jgi:uncharacterized protein
VTSGEEVLKAIEDGDLGGLEEVLARHPQAASARDANGISAVLNAQYRGREDLVQMLLAAHPALDIFEASAVGDADRIPELLGQDPSLATAWSSDGYTPLHLAAFFGHQEVAQLLLDPGADVSAISRNVMAVMPLHSAAASGQGSIAELLLDRGAKVDARSHEGYTALLEAAQNGDADLVDLLLSNGADPKLALDDGRTAGELAAEKGHTTLVERLRGRAG